MSGRLPFKEANLMKFLRSQIARWTVALLAFALVAAACGGTSDSGQGETTTTAPTTTQAPAAPSSSTTTTVAPSNEKPYGGTVVVADDQEPPTLNPLVPGGDNLIVGIIGQAYQAGVSEIDGFTLELIPELVAELPTVENGGVTVNADGTMTVRYAIKDEAVWSDGVPISGADFQFTLDTIMNPDYTIVTTTYEDIVSTSVGDKSFEYTLSAPTVLFELLFGTVLPKHAIEGSDFLNDWNDVQWPSAGPFIFAEWQKGEFVRVVRNANYWGVDAETGQTLPYLDEVIFRFIPETDSILTAFKAREVDIIQPPPSTELIEALQALEPEGARVEALAGTIWEHLNFQFGPNRFVKNPDSINDNLNYRKAVAHTIDKSLIVDEILAGQVEPMDSFVEVYRPTISLGSWSVYDYNPEKARELLDLARAETGQDVIKTVFTTTSNNDARVKLSELFQTMFEDVGIEYSNQLEESQLFFGETLDSGSWDFGEWAWSSAPGMSGLIGSLDLFDPENPAPAGDNTYQWGTETSSVQNDVTARFAALRDEANQSVDESVLVPLVQEAEQILADNVVIIPLYARLSVAASWADEVGGFKHNPTSAAHTWNIQDWYRVDG